MTARKPGSMYGWPWRDKLAAIVVRGAADDCWPATGASIAEDGYAHIQSADTTETLVHRLAVIADGRVIPPGQEVDHVAGRCSRRDCANPAHLEVVTKEENLRRQAAVQPRKQVCKYGHDKSDAYRYGNRWQCRQCTLDKSRARSALRKLGLGGTS